MTSSPAGEPHSPRKRPSIDVPPSVLSILSEKLGEAPRVSLDDEPSQAGGAPLIDPASSERNSTPEGRANYQVLGEIARGGMGVVLRGHDTDLGRDVAMKVLAKELADRPEVVQRFVEEAQIGGQLQHPGIVPVYELGLMADDRPYFTMKLVKGRTLAMLLGERESVNSERRRLVDVFLSTCQTVAYAHSRGVIHRDLKPANIMVGAFGEVQVVDWGLAKVMARGGKADEKRARDAQSHLTVLETVRSDGSSTGTESLVGSVLGTPAYMPPEQARGQVDKLDERADVFSLGAILCEILTGAPPYTAPKDQVIGQAAQAELEDAYARLEACEGDPGLVKLAQQCLVAAPAARPRNAGVLAEAVQTHLEGIETRSQEARVEAAEARVRAAQERKARRLTVLLAGSILLLVVVGGGGWARMRSQEVRRQSEQARNEAEALRDLRERERTVEGSLSEARLLAARGDWEGARLSLARASTLAGSAEVSGELSSLVEAASAEVEASAESDRSARELELDTARLLEELELARRPVGLDMTASQEDDVGELLEKFAAIFESHGLDEAGSEPAELAAQLRARGLGAEIALLLDLWAGNRRLAGDEEGAVRLIDTAHLVDPEPVRADLREAVVNDDLEMLRTLARSDLAEQPDETLELLAVALDRVGDQDLAIDVLSRGLASHPGSASLHRWLVEWLAPGPKGLETPAERKRGRRALQHARAVTALEPDNIPSRLDLGMLLMRLGEFDSARLVFERVADEVGDASWALMGMAWHLTSADPADPAASALFEQVVAQSDTRALHFWSNGMLAHSYFAQGRVEEAKLASERARQNMGRQLDELWHLISLYLVPADLDTADELFDTYSPRSARSFNTMAWLIVRTELRVRPEQPRGDVLESALRYSEGALERAPEDGNHWNTAGVVKLLLGSHEDAREAFARSIAATDGVGLVEDRLGMAICLAEAGELEPARTWFERARSRVDGTVDAGVDEVLGWLTREAARRIGVPSPLVSAE